MIKTQPQEFRGRATAVKDLFQGLSLQYKSLLTELSRTSSISLKKPTVEGPPFSVESFDKIITFQRDVNIQLADSNKSFTLLQSRLASLKESAVNQLSEYAKHLKTDPENHFLLYEKYGWILNSQGEYALLQIKKPKLEKQLAELNDIKKICNRMGKRGLYQP